ncbi:lipid II flippase MurJ [Noviherbaspirillum sp. CPCC 100848]|uniref:Lipid II flippase MurJ n=1 Tax=Noviherbaspirillum album TaxID=3080276 RepID=A0ABU6J6Q0_9BURK|nr:lipid II flippase MurJ [Noviherbaspirillum sp. CPCC 100848]MEC4719291.1 lipid II flippase MurJ [Noviherbaspirillum sp. CPCC 100848]
MSLLSAATTRIKASHSDHRAIFRGIAWVSLFVVLAKVAGAIKEMAVAYQYGVGAEVDAYLYLFNIISWPVGVWFAVLTVVLVPLASRIHREAPLDLPRFRAELLGQTLLACAALFLLSWLALALALSGTWSGLPDEATVIAERMLLPLLALGPLGLLASLLSAWTLAAGRHANTLLEGVPSLTIAAALLMLPASGIEWLVWATVAGFVIHLACLLLPLIRRAEIEAPVLALSSPHWKSFFQGFGILLAGQALMTLIGFIDIYFAASLGSGAVSMLGYANRVLALLLGLGATVAGRAMLPVFSRAAARGGKGQWRLVRQWACLLFLVGAAAAAAGWALSPWAVQILFERGAFSAHDTQAVAEVLRYGLFQLPFYFGGLVLVTYASSRGQYRLLFWPGVIGIAVKITANLLLIPSLGLNGIALGWVAVYAATALFFRITLGRIR